MSSAVDQETRIDRWDPESPVFWEQIGKKIARRNLISSILTEHVGFSVWTLWSVLVLFMGPEYGLSVADKFLLLSTPTAVGALLRLPYMRAVTKLGGRNWTIISALLLLVPSVLTLVVMTPGSPFWAFLLAAAVTGLGGGNFASSMRNINAFYPQRLKGRALGLNAGGGNVGVAVTQLVGLLVLGTVGNASPRLILWIYLPLVLIAALCAAVFMDNIQTGRDHTGEIREVAKGARCWELCLLYIGTFGSFIGYSFAFGLVLQYQFGQTPLQAASLTFLGPLLGSLTRPIGGWLADRHGAARVVLATFLLMILGTVIAVLASDAHSLALFTAGFVALFVLTGVGNGSTFALIPAVFRTRRQVGAVMGVTGAAGALGGLLINLAFWVSFTSGGQGTLAYLAFVAFYAACAAVVRVRYL
jgi:NNP family nitrate/nitrite transporter-like MFS transporter